MLALPIRTGENRISWPRAGHPGWCANSDGEVDQLTIVRIELVHPASGQAPLCQLCYDPAQAGQGVLFDLFERRAA